jgi:hypothetical protein
MDPEAFTTEKYSNKEIGTLLEKTFYLEHSVSR